MLIFLFVGDMHEKMFMFYYGLCLPYWVIVLHNSNMPPNIVYVQFLFALLQAMKILSKKRLMKKAGFFRKF